MQPARLHSRFCWGKKEMGERNNIVVTDGKDTVRFYAHWHSPEMLVKVVHSALSRKKRWDDYPYLSRIIFCDLIKGDVEGETGFGIVSSAWKSGGTDVVTVNVSAQEVLLPAQEPISFCEFLETRS